MESWRNVWRTGVVPLLSTESLTALRAGLESNDPKLIQGATCQPPPIACVKDWPVEAACVLGYCGMADGLNTVGEVEEFFARMCHEIDGLMGEPAACRWLLNWWDDRPRDEVRRELLAEVTRTLAERTATAA